MRSNLGGSVCDWGDNMPDVDEEVRFTLLEEEGIRYDKNGRILGGRFEFSGVEESMKGTMIEKYIDRFPYRFGGWH